MYEDVALHEEPTAPHNLALDKNRDWRQHLYVSKGRTRQRRIVLQDGPLYARVKDGLTVSRFNETGKWYMDSRVKTRSRFKFRQCSESKNILLP